MGRFEGELAEGLEAQCYNVKAAPLKEPTRQRKSCGDLVGGCTADGPVGSGRSSSVGAGAEPPHRGTRERLDHPSQVNSILRTGGGWAYLQTVDSAGGLGPVLTASRAGVGTGSRGLLFRGQGEGEPNPLPRSESDLLSPPFLPKNTFLAKSPREEGDPFPREAAGGAAAARPQRPWPGREGEREAAPYPACPASSRVSHSNGSVAAAILSGEKKRKKLNPELPTV